MALRNEEKRLWLLLVGVVAVVTAVTIQANLLPLTLISMVALLGIVLIVALLAHRPGLLFISYLLALPAYTLTLASVYRFTDSATLINLLQPWKEAAAILVLTLMLLQIVVTYRLPRLHPLDVLVLLFFGLNLLYLLLPWGDALDARLYGFRANTFWVIVYWLGRLVPLTRSQQKWILGLLATIGALTGLMVIVEILALPPDWPVHVGLMDYLRDFFGVSPRGHYGLTWTFETTTGLRRRSAFWANPLELASSTLITGVAALYLLFRYHPRTWGRFWSISALGLIVLSLFLSVSRASLIAFAIQMFVVSIWLRKPRLTLLYASAFSIGLVLLLSFAGERVTDFIWETVTFQNDSSQGHVRGWMEGAQAIWQQPWGLGLGSSGHVGNRFGDQVGGENQFVIIGVDLGVIGVALYSLILLSAIWFSLRAFYMTEGVTRGLVFVTAASRLALLIPTFTSHIEVYVFAMFTTWWLVGFAIQQLVAMQFQGSPSPTLTAAPEGV
jgi:hypothetical protein